MATKQSKTDCHALFQNIVDFTSPARIGQVFTQIDQAIRFLFTQSERALNFTMPPDMLGR